MDGQEKQRLMESQYGLHFYNWSEGGVCVQNPDDGTLIFVPGIFDPSKDKGIYDLFEKLSNNAQDVIKSINRDTVAWSKFTGVFIQYLMSSKMFKDIKPDGVKPSKMRKKIERKIERAEKAIKELSLLTWPFGVDEPAYYAPLEFLAEVKRKVRENFKNLYKDGLDPLEQNDVKLVTELFGIVSEMGLDVELVTEIARAGYRHVHSNEPPYDWMEYTLKKRQQGKK